MINYKILPFKFSKKLSHIKKTGENLLKHETIFLLLLLVTGFT